MIIYIIIDNILIFLIIYVVTNYNLTQRDIY